MEHTVHDPEPRAHPVGHESGHRRLGEINTLPDVTACVRKDNERYVRVDAQRSPGTGPVAWCEPPRIHTVRDDVRARTVSLARQRLAQLFRLADDGVRR